MFDHGFKSMPNGFASCHIVFSCCYALQRFWYFRLFLRKHFEARAPYTSFEVINDSRRNPCDWCKLGGVIILIDYDWNLALSIERGTYCFFDYAVELAYLICWVRNKYVCSLLSLRCAQIEILSVGLTLTIKLEQSYDCSKYPKY